MPPPRFSLLGFHVVQLIGTMYHHLRLGPLARTAAEAGAAAEGRPAPVPAPDCVAVPVVGEVCVTAEAEATEAAAQAVLNPEGETSE